MASVSTAVRPALNIRQKPGSKTPFLAPAWPATPPPPEVWDRFAAHQKLARTNARKLSRELGRTDLEDAFLDEFYAMLLDNCQRWQEGRGRTLKCYIVWGQKKAARRCRQIAWNTGRSSVATPDDAGTPQVDLLPAPEPTVPPDGDLSGLLGMLTPNQAEAVQAVFLDGLTYAQAARRMGVVPVRVGHLIEDARERLRRQGRAA